MVGSLTTGSFAVQSRWMCIAHILQTEKPSLAPSYFSFPTPPLQDQLAPLYKILRTPSLVFFFLQSSSASTRRSNFACPSRLSSPGLLPKIYIYNRPPGLLYTTQPAVPLVSPSPVYTVQHFQSRQPDVPACSHCISSPHPICVCDSRILECTAAFPAPLSSRHPAIRPCDLPTVLGLSLELW
jgi:hypothetical protein